MATPFEIVYGTASIRSVNASGIISTLTLTSTDSVYIAKGGIKFAADIIVDASGNTYVADATNHVIWKISPSNVVTRIAGTGSGGNTGDGGAALSAKLSQPYFLAIDTAGNIYVYDYDYYIIRAINTQATTQVLLGVSIGAGDIKTVAGVASQFGNTGDGAAATSAKLDEGGSMCVDPSGNLWLACPDFHRVRKIATTGVITTAIGTGTAGTTGDGGAAGSCEMEAPNGIACDLSGNLYICDGSIANTIRAVNQQGTTQSLLNISIGAGDIATVAGNGIHGFSGDGGAAISAKLEISSNVSVDFAGNLWIADYSGRIRKVTAGIINTVAGNGTLGSTGDGGAATSAEIGGTGAIMSLTFASPSNPATVTSVSPAVGVVAGGTSVTITGTGFLSGATVTFGGVSATDVVFVSSTELTAVTPPGVGTVNVQVTNPSAPSGTLVNGFTYLISVGLEGTFEDAAGNPISGGTFSLRLNSDAVAADGTLLTDDLVSITLDSTGSIPPNVRVNTTATLRSLQARPVDVYYRMSVSTSTGQRVWKRDVNVLEVDPFVIEDH
jgi:hypothetical protein